MMKLRFTKKRPFPSLYQSWRKRGSSFFARTCVLILVLASCGPAVQMACAQPKPFAIDKRLAEAESLLREKDYKKAIKAFKRLNAQKGKKSLVCYWGMAQAYWGLRDFKKTEEICDRALQYARSVNYREVALVHNLKGLAAAQRALAGDHKKFKEAEKEFQTAYKLEKGYPDRPTILFNLGITQLQAGEVQQGTATLKNYLDESPHSPGAARARRMIGNPRLAVAPAAPNFSLKTLNGQTYSLAQLRGKIVLLDFWATWCPSCRESIPSLVHLRKKFSGAPFVVISVSADKDAKTWRNFVQKHHMLWPQYLDSKRYMQRLYNVHYLPTYILIDQGGAIMLRQAGWGEMTEMRLQYQISKRLAKTSKRTALSSKQ